MIEHDKYRAETKHIAGRAGQSRRHHITGMIEGFVAAELMREAALAHHAERDRGNGGSDRSTGYPGENLRGADDEEIRPHQNGD